MRRSLEGLRRIVVFLAGEQPFPFGIYEYSTCRDMMLSCPSDPADASLWPLYSFRWPEKSDRKMRISLLFQL
jgi:hypothetical protein